MSEKVKVFIGFENGKAVYVRGSWKEMFKLTREISFKNLSFKHFKELKERGLESKILNFKKGN